VPCIRRYVLEDATQDSLVLVDELGKGTEVRAGAAIAASVLETLDATGCKVRNVHRRSTDGRVTGTPHQLLLVTLRKARFQIAHRLSSSKQVTQRAAPRCCCRASLPPTCTRCWTWTWMRSASCACAWRRWQMDASSRPPCGCCPASAPSELLAPGHIYIRVRSSYKTRMYE
jgi:MutS domain V